MRLLFDTNVLLDVLLDRNPWVTDSKTVWQANDEGRIVGYILASTLTDIFYIAKKASGVVKALEAVSICLDTFEICVVGRELLELALGQPGSDFEDNLQIAAAITLGLDAIITRDEAGFKNAVIKALSPKEVMSQLKP